MRTKADRSVIIKEIRLQLAVLNKISPADPFAARCEQLLDEEIERGSRKAQLGCLLSEVRMALQDTVERSPSGTLPQIAGLSLKPDEDFLADIVDKVEISSDDEFREAEQAVARIVEQGVGDSTRKELIGLANDRLAAYEKKKQS